MLILTKSVSAVDDGVCLCCFFSLSSAIWVQLWIVELLVTVRVLPLEALSYIVITLPFTMPRILNLQLALPAAFKEQLKGHVRLLCCPSDAFTALHCRPPSTHSSQHNRLWRHFVSH